MMKHIRHISLGLFAAMVAFPASNALATSERGKALDEGVQVVLEQMPAMDKAFDTKIELLAQRDGHIISASQAKSIAMRHVSGAKFINIQMVGSGTYRVRLQKNGRIIDVYVDARTGAVK
ncbi:MAG: PepSY domain-containing protein [Robiginitomaculum sp.]